MNDGPHGDKGHLPPKGKFWHVEHLRVILNLVQGFW